MCSLSYENMPCDSETYSYQSLPVPIAEVKPGSYLDTPFGPWLIVSNAPEIVPLGATDPITLYKAPIPVPAGSIPFRVFVWHIHTSSRDFEVGFQLSFEYSVITAKAKISNLRLVTRIETPNDGYVAAGQCLADAQLNGTLDPVTPSEIGIDGPDTLIWTSGQTSHVLIGAVIEFDVVTEDAGNLLFRSFATRSSDRGTYAQVPIAVTQHVRGWWPRSTMLLTANVSPIDLKDSYGPNEGVWQTGVIEQSVAPELSTLEGFGALSGFGHLYDTPNKGCYGVNLTYRHEINSIQTSFGANAWFSLKSRNIDPHRFWGAARNVNVTSNPTQISNRKVPKLPLAYPEDPPTLVNNGIDLCQGSIPNSVFVPKDIDLIIDVSIAVGGGAGTPVAIVVYGINPVIP